MSEMKHTPRQILAKELRLGAAMLVACPCVFWTSIWLGKTTETLAHSTAVEAANYVTAAAGCILLGIGSIALLVFGLVATIDGVGRAQRKIAVLKAKATGAAQ